LYRTERRNAYREEELNAAWEAVARGPSAHEAAVLIESIERLGRFLEAHQARMLTLLLEGQNPAEIAQQIGYSRRMVERFRERLRERLQRMLDEDQDAPAETPSPSRAGPHS
jgi:DNA-directed RNA polymerase specialized sigma24 family protein